MDTSSSYERIKLPIKDAFLIRFHNRFQDQRGLFEQGLAPEFICNDRGDQIEFVQENFSHSHAGVIRGMHMQSVNPQGKLIKCVSGMILDCFFDVRLASPTFMKGHSVRLTGLHSDYLYVPPGCLHGFQARAANTIVQYKCTTHYNKQSDGGVYYADPDMALPWNLERPILSDKDKQLPSLREFVQKLYG